MELHASRGDVIKRLKRASGHLEKVIGMLEIGDGCLAIAQQLQAVVSALEAAKKLHVQEHIEHCLTDTLDLLPRGVRQHLAELRALTKYL